MCILDGFRGAQGSNINSSSSGTKGKVDSSLQSPDDPISDESGVGHEEEEAELLLELLSNIRTPKVIILIYISTSKKIFVFGSKLQQNPFNDSNSIF